ncbi:hypothetical protein J6590_059429 [Homalodisca vitripennis]|nr:hypothetical protein J6590_059429 [Homalodisca vitripennis]
MASSVLKSSRHVYLRALDMLSVAAQEHYPYHVRKVDSNDVLYGSDPKFLVEINKTCSVIVEEVLNQLKVLGAADLYKQQAALALDLFTTVMMRGDLSSPGLATLAVNLWNLANKHNQIDSKKQKTTYAFLKKRFLLVPCSVAAFTDSQVLKSSFKLFFQVGKEEIIIIIVAARNYTPAGQLLQHETDELEHCRGPIGKVRFCLKSLVEPSSLLGHFHRGAKLPRGSYMVMNGEDWRHPPEHHGSVKVEGLPDHGSSFMVSCPYLNSSNHWFIVEKEGHSSPCIPTILL